MSTNDDEIDEAEATLTTTIEEEPPITFSEIKKDWYVLKNKIQKKDCFHFIKLIDQIEEALYLDCHEKQKQSSIGDFFYRSEPNLPRKKQRIVIEIENEHSEWSETDTDGTESAK